MTFSVTRFSAIAALTLLFMNGLATAVRADAESEYEELGDLFLKQYNAGYYDKAEKTAGAMRKLAEGPLRNDPEKLLWAVNRQAWVCESRGKLADAERLYLWALDEAQRISGPESENVAIIVNNLGNLRESQYRYAEAEQLLKQNVEMGRRNPNTDRSTLAVRLESLASLYDKMGRYVKADDLYREVLAIRQKKYGRQHEDVATVLNNMACLYSHWGYLKDAVKLNEEALQIRRELFPGDHMLVANSLNNLACTLDDDGQYAKAEVLYREAMAMDKRIFGDEHSEVARDLNNLGELYKHQARYGEAEKAHQQALKIRRKVFGPEHSEVALSLGNLACLYEKLGHFDEAELLHGQELAILRKVLGPNDPEVAGTLSKLGSLVADLGRYEEAESMLKQALTINEKTLPPHSLQLAVSSNDLAVFYLERGRYGEAEPLFSEALSIDRAVYGSNNPEVATVLSGMAIMYGNENRQAAAESTHKQALAIRKKFFGDEHPDVADSLNHLGNLYVNMRRLDEAEPLLKQALEIRRKRLGENHPLFADSLDTLARLRAAQSRYSDAESLELQSLAIARRTYSDSHPTIANSLCDVARIYRLQKRYADAEKILDNAIPKLERGGASPSRRMGAYETRAGVLWETGRREDAVKDLRKALDLAEQVRAQASGGEQRRSWAFARFVGAFEQMVAWQTELGDLNEALGAMERRRARALWDQMETRAMDLLAGVASEKAKKLLKRERESAEKIAKLEKQLQVLGYRRDLAASDREAQQKKLEEELDDARWDYFDAREDIRNASPSYRLALGQDRKPVALEKLSAWTADQHALLLEYLFGWEGGYVLVIPAGGKPRLEKLSLTAQQAAVLATNAGPLTAGRLEKALSGEKDAGPLRQLRQPEGLGDAAASLAALWKQLIPRPEREAILAGKYERIIVVPDGPLAQLPLETLVVEAGEPGKSTKYLLDAGPPILYAPSATILVNLAERKEEAEKPAGQSVLTIGDCRYPQPASEPRESALAQLTPRARYRSACRGLKPLPFSATEIQWVSKVFGEKGKVAWLKDDLATEAQVRFNAPGRRLLHFACHGLVDQSYGNLFGALALTPGIDYTNPANDGYLTLAEICELNLKGCELAILSACETNIGPTQWGEGVSAISHGFLVAGARRVVASNWLVDDEAAPNFVSYFTSILAKAEKEGKMPDYAEAVHRAKLFLRRHKNKQWQNPYYWGTFVLIGPH